MMRLVMEAVMVVAVVLVMTFLMKVGTTGNTSEKPDEDSNNDASNP